MSELRIKIKRQIEIIGMVLAGPGKYTALDLEETFSCTTVTIKRDLSDIRSMGVNIHSIPRKGIVIEGSLPEDLIKSFLGDYVLTVQTGGTLLTATALLSKAIKEQALVNFTILQRAIEGGNEIELVYLKNDKAQQKTRTIVPLLLFEKQSEWRILADEEGKRKQFLLQKIKDIRILPRVHAAGINAGLIQFVDNSFGAWVGGNEITVELLFTKRWLASGKLPLLAENQQTENQPDGTVKIKCAVNSLEDVARWLAARGGEVVALSPPELRNTVIGLASDTLKAY